jgi:hypothetical protein
MLFTFKKNKTLRSCVDYQRFNVVTFKNKCSLSLIDEFLDHLQDVMFFIKLDIKNAFNKLCIREKDE